MIDALISLIQDVISPLQWSLSWVNILEIAFIAVILLVFYQKFIKNTQSEKLVKGLLLAHLEKMMIMKSMLSRKLSKL